MTTQRQVVEYAEANDIRLNMEGGRLIHIHAYAPKGKVFTGSMCSNASCGEYMSKKEVDWDFVMSELELMDFDPDLCEAEDD